MARKDKGGSAGASPSHSRRAHSQPHSSPGKSSHNNNGNSPNGNGSGRSKGVPQSFGYIKRQANGSGMASNMVTMDAQQHLMLNPQGQQQQPQQGNRSTAQVSAVPRGSKIKMSPGPNQSTQDLHASKCGRVTDIRTVITFGFPFSRHKRGRCSEQEFLVDWTRCYSTQPVDPRAIGHVGVAQFA